MKQVVCNKNELRPGTMMKTTLGRIPIVVCRTLDGECYAFSDRCIHQGAPMSKGILCGASAPTNTPGEYCYVKEGEILRCPWHGREYDIKNEGRMLADPSRKLPSFHVSIEEDSIVVSK